jgi:hypothetical protein
MKGNGVFTVREIPGPRWEIAIDQLIQGRGHALLEGDVDVVLRRWVTGPSPDPRLSVGFYANQEPSQTSAAMAAAEIAKGLDAYRAALSADPRLSSLAEQHGHVIEYVYDYGTAAVLVATVSDDGTFTWASPFGPGSKA